MSVIIDGTTGLSGPAATLTGTGAAATLTATTAIGVNTLSPAVAVHVINGTISGGTIRLENSLTSLASTNSYGQIEFFGNDNSPNANGVRGKISAAATGTTGGTALKFYTANGSTTTLTEGLTIAGVVVSATSLSASNLTATVAFFTNNVTTFSGSLFMINTDTTVDIDITQYFPAAVTSNYFMEARVNGLYIDNPATPVTVNRLFKAWAQNISYTGSTYAIAGAVLMYAVYNSDATNFPAGAVNAVKVQTIVNTTKVLLRFTNRTSPAAASNTYFAYEVKVINA